MPSVNDVPFLHNHPMRAIALVPFYFAVFSSYCSKKTVLLFSWDPGWTRFPTWGNLSYYLCCCHTNPSLSPSGWRLSPENKNKIRNLIHTHCLEDFQPGRMLTDDHIKITFFEKKIIISPVSPRLHRKLSANSTLLFVSFFCVCHCPMVTLE